MDDETQRKEDEKRGGKPCVAQGKTGVYQFRNNVLASSSTDQVTSRLNADKPSAE